MFNQLPGGICQNKYHSNCVSSLKLIKTFPTAHFKTTMMSKSISYTTKKSVCFNHILWVLNNLQDNWSVWRRGWMGPCIEIQKTNETWLSVSQSKCSHDDKVVVYQILFEHCFVNIVPDHLYIKVMGTDGHDLWPVPMSVKHYTAHSLDILNKYEALFVF